MRVDVWDNLAFVDTVGRPGMVVVIRAFCFLQAVFMFIRSAPTSALDTAHVTLSWHMIYYYLILNFDYRPALEDSVWYARILAL